MIKESTKVGNSNSCIDHIYSNSDFISNSGTLDWNYSDHPAIFVNNKKIRKNYQKIEFIGRSYTNYNKEDFQDNLRMYNWNPFFVLDDPNECWSILFNRIISTLVNTKKIILMTLKEIVSQMIIQLTILMIFSPKLVLS